VDSVWSQRLVRASRRRRPGARRSSCSWARFLGWIALVGLGCGRGRETATPLDRLGLAARLGPVRPIEGRLVGIRYAAYRGQRGAVRAGLPTPSAGGGATATRGSAVSHRPTEDLSSPDRLGGRALRRLVAGDLDRAVTDLEGAAALDPRSAVWRSDLAAAYLEQADVRLRPYALALAFHAADAAADEDPTLLPARFNRALALEKLCLDTQAIAAWSDYLAREREPAWRAEAESRLRALRASPAGELWREARPRLVNAAERGDRAAVLALVRQFPRPARELAEGEMLPGWARRQGAVRSAEAERPLGIARGIGEALASLYQDEMVRETVAIIDTVLAAPNQASRLRRLIAGHRLAGRGRVQYAHTAFARAKATLLRARGELAAARSPFVGRIDFELARCAYQHYDYLPAQQALQRLLARQTGLPHPILRSDVLALLGLVQIVRDEPMSALASLSAALSQAHALGDPANAAQIEAEIATQLEDLGQADAAWPHVLASLREARQLDIPGPRFLAFEQAALSAERAGESRLAMAFQDEVVATAERSRMPHLIVEALRGRALIHEAAGDRRQPLADLEEAGREARGLPDLQTREILAADLARVQGELEKASDPRGAIRSLWRAARLYRKTGYRQSLPKLLLEQGLALAALGREDEAERALASAVAERERQRGRISNPWYRISYFDDLHEVFDAMLRFELAVRRRTDLAFEYAERGRARLLLDLLPEPSRDPAGGAPRPLGLAAIRRGLPPRTALIEYWLLDDRLVAWVARRDGLRPHVTFRPRAEVERLAEQLHDDLVQGHVREADELAAELYDLLIRPLRDDLPAQWDLAIVPDGALHLVPFAGLRDRNGGRRLVEDHPMATVPSASALVAGARRPASRDPLGPALAVNDPAFDPATFPTLSRLSFAGAAIAAWVREHPGSGVQAGEGATKDAFLAAAGRYSIVHFSGHAEANLDSPQRSRLIFAAVPGRKAEDGVLYAKEALGHRFAHTRLLVLAACDTAMGRVSRSEGMLSLSLPFVAAGIPAVISTLWSVEDAPTERFFTSFYRHLSRERPLEALRRAQLDMLAEEHAGRQPETRAWAAFELTGWTR
jgi:CHAT domain-containing protein